MSKHSLIERYETGQEKIYSPTQGEIRAALIHTFCDEMERGRNVPSWTLSIINKAFDRANSGEFKL